MPTISTSISTVIFSGRTSYLDQALAQFRQALPVSALVGIGRGSQGHIIEMDPVEVLVYYGLLGALMLVCIGIWLVNKAPAKKERAR